MMLYIHGFGSCGWGHKSLRLRRFFGTARVIAPDLPFAPDAAIERLRALLQRYPISALVGASLGGFYATCLNTRTPRPSVLINPVVRPGELQADFAGTHRRWCDELPFTVDETYRRALVALQRDRVGHDESYLVLLNQGDELLDYRQAEQYYHGHDVRALRGGDHRFSDIDGQLPHIADWLTRQGALKPPRPE